MGVNLSSVRRYHKLVSFGANKKEFKPLTYCYTCLALDLNDRFWQKAAVDERPETTVSGRSYISMHQ